MANTKITTAVIKDDAITTAKIADDAVTGALIADDVALAGNPTTTTQSAGNNTTRIATTAFVTTAINNLVDSAPSALDTLNELAAAMGDDANFSTTVTNSIATKLPLAGGTMTGNLEIDVGSGTNAGITLRMGTGSSGANDSFIGFENSAGTEVIRTRYDNPTTSYVISSDTSGDIVTVQRGGNAIIGGTTSSLPSSGTPGLEVAGSGFSGMAAIARYDNNAYGPALFLVKSRASNASGHTIVADDDNLGAISWTPDDGTNRDTYAASIAAKVDGTPGANDMPTRLEFMTTADGAASPTTRLTIDSSGDMSMANEGEIFFNASSSSQETRLGWNYTGTLQSWIEREHSDGSLVFGNQGSERMRIDSNGNFLVGTTDVSQYNNASGADHGTVIGASSFIDISRNGNPMLYLNRTDSDGQLAYFSREGSGKGALSTRSGYIWLETVTSDGSDTSGVVLDGGAGGGSTARGAVIAAYGNENSSFPGQINLQPGASGKIQTYYGASATAGAAFNSSGNLTFPSGKGIDFSATADSVSNMTSELLDDYEEGTWTPSFNCTGATFNHDTQTGYYTKIGNKVSFTCLIGTDGVTGSYASNGLTIVGLPFASNNSYSGSTGLSYSWGSSVANTHWQIGTGDSFIYLYQPNNGASFVTGSFLATGGNKNRLWITGHYYTDS